MQRSRHGVGIIEFDFEYTASLSGRRFSIRPAIELLATRPFERVPFFFFHIATRADLEYRLAQWAVRRDRLPILYVAGHGDPGVVNVGSGVGASDRIKLDDLIDLIAERSDGCWLHVGSCAALAESRSRLEGMLRRTGLSAMSGFTRRVDYLPSAAFELLLLEALVNRSMNSRGVTAMRRWATVHARGPFSSLGFRIVAP